MSKRLLLFVLSVVGLAIPGHAELVLKILSVTEVSQTYQLTRPQAEVSLCNLGTKAAYFRLFWEGETVAAATTSYNILPAGTAAAPYCIAIGTAKTQPGYWRALSIICAAGETATVHVQSE